MKKIIAYLLIALMCVSSLAACGKEKVNEDLQAAIDYVYAMYKDAPAVTANDFERTAQVMIGTTAYTVEWSVDNEAIKVTVADKIATIDVDEKAAAVTQVWKYIGELIFNMLVLVGTIKISDRVVREMMGL